MVISEATTGTPLTQRSTIKGRHQAQIPAELISRSYCSKLHRLLMKDQMVQMGSHLQRIWRTLNWTHSLVQAVPPDHELDVAVPFGLNHKGELDFAITN